MKKGASICMLMLFFVVTMLGMTGCQSGAQTTEAPTKLKTDETQPEESIAAQTTSDELLKEKVTITWYFRRPIDNMSAQESIEKFVNENYFNPQLNADLKMFPVDVAAFDEKMRVMSAGGEAYDLVMTTCWANPILTNVTNGSFAPLDDLLKTYGKAIWERIDERAWAAVTYNGKIMAIPTETPWAQPNAIVFKKELVEKYDFDYRSVKHLRDTEPFLELIKENEPDITPLFGSPGCWNTRAVSITSGISYLEDTGEIILDILDPFNRDTYKMLADFYAKGYIAKDAVVRTEVVQEIKTGKYAVFTDPGGYTEDGSKSSGMYGFPCAEALYAYPLITTNGITAAGNAISSTSKNPERTMMLYNLIWEDRFLSNTLAYGLEGQNYKVVSGDIHKPEDDAVIEAFSGEEQTWAIWHNWVGPLWDQWSSNWNTTAALQEMRDNNINAPVSRLTGFTFDPEPVKNEVAQLNAIVQEVDPILNTGSAPDIDKYMDEVAERLNSAGAAKVIEEVKNQIAEWEQSK